MAIKTDILSDSYDLSALIGSNFREELSGDRSRLRHYYLEVLVSSASYPAGQNDAYIAIETALDDNKDYQEVEGGKIFIEDGNTDPYTVRINDLTAKYVAVNFVKGSIDACQIVSAKLISKT